MNSIMNPKVSVLVPIYNVSPFIEKCLHSLFKQTFQDIEYVFVNDCTADDSMQKLGKVIELYPQRKNQIKIIHHTHNRGLAAVRNTAIDNSSGEYILVVDSDDYINLDYVEEMYLFAKKENADIVVSDFIMEYPDKTIIETEVISDTSKERIYNVITEKSLSLWNKLMRRDLYARKDCRVPEGLNYYEDRHVLVRLYYYAANVIKIDKAFYHYVQYNADSITRKIRHMHFENTVRYWTLLDSFLKGKNIFHEYEDIVSLFKVSNKAKLMCYTNDLKLRKEFADIFLQEEKKISGQLKKGYQVMLFLVRNKLFVLAQLYRKLSVLKHKLLKKN